MKTKTIRSILIKWGIRAFFALGIIGILMVWIYRAEEKKQLTDYAPVSHPPVGVTVATAQTGEMVRWTLAEGIARAVRKTHLRFEEEGRITYLADDALGQKLREGSPVSGPEAGDSLSPGRGQLLAKLDCRDKNSRIRQSEADLTAARKLLEVQKSALKQADAQLEESRLDMERKKRLAGQELIARSEYDKALARYKIALEEVGMTRSRISEAKARVKSAEQERDYAVRGIEKRTIYAPFKGVIARLNIREGDYFNPDTLSTESNSTLLETSPITLIDPDLIEAVLYLPDFMADKIEAGQNAVVTPAMETWAPGTEFNTARKAEGMVYSVSPHIDSVRRAVRIRVRLARGTRVVTDGMAVSCWIRAEQRKGALRIPTAGLLYSDSSPYVYLVKAGHARRQWVSTGIEDMGYTEVLEGLMPGDQVVLKGRQKLYEGAIIRVIPERQVAHVR